MNRYSYAALAVVLTGASGAICAAETFKEAIGESTGMFDFRVRYEDVEQTGIDESAAAMTSRLRAGFKTGKWFETSLLGEAVAIEDIVGDYNSTTNGNTEYPVVADPSGFAKINRFAFTNTSIDHTTLTLGRQRIILDDSRFVGNVGWRQNEQTYDGLRATIDTKVEVDVTYINQVNRIFGPDSPAGKWHGDIALVNVSRGLPWGKLTGFAYGVDLDESAALSSNTVGLRLSGSKELDAFTILYTVSAAQQSDAGANPSDYSENYYLVEGGLKFNRITAALGFEQLGSDGVSSVQTPLATLHAFQGWADKFLATPADGMNDSYVRIAYQYGKSGPFTGLSLVGVYHDFDSDVGSTHYGEELDLSFVAKTDRISLTLKYADYQADELLTDTSKWWLSMDYAF